MVIAVIPWSVGTGNITVESVSDAQGVNKLLVSSDANLLKTSRSQILTFKTQGVSVVTKQLLVKQESAAAVLLDSNQFRLLDSENNILMSWELNS